MQYPKILLAAALSCGAWFAAPAWADSPITVENPYVRLMPPNMPNTGAFMVIKNHSNADRKLVKAESPVAQTVQLHNHIHDGNVMRMREVPSVDIKANGEAVLQPGSLHIMLIGLKQPLKEGERVPLTLNFDDGSSLKVEAPVQRIQPMAMPMNGQGQMHEGMQH